MGSTSYQDYFQRVLTANYPTKPGGVHYPVIGEKGIQIPKKPQKKKRPMKGAKSSAISEARQPVAKAQKMAAPGEADEEGENTTPSEAETGFETDSTDTDVYSEHTESDDTSDAGGPTTEDELTAWDIADTKVEVERTVDHERSTKDHDPVRVGIDPESAPDNSQAAPALSRNQGDKGSRTMIAGVER